MGRRSWHPAKSIANATDAKLADFKNLADALHRLATAQYPNELSPAFREACAEFCYALADECQLQEVKRTPSLRRQWLTKWLNKTRRGA